MSLRYTTMIKILFGGRRHPKGISSAIGSLFSREAFAMSNINGFPGPDRIGAVDHNFTFLG